MSQQPDSMAGARTAAVVFVTGFSDSGAQAMPGCKLKDMSNTRVPSKPSAERGR